jgi:heptosyltransferase-2
MGDVLLATPLVRELRKRFPDARIDICVNEEWSEIFRHNPYCNNVLAYKRSWSRAEFSSWKQEIVRSVKETTGSARYDWVLDLQRNNRSRHIRRGLGQTVRRISKHRLHKLALVYLKSNFHSKTLHVTERFRKAASALDVQDDGQGLEFWLRGEDVPHSRTETAGTNTLRIGLAPGAHHATKRWLPERFAESALLLAERFQNEGKNCTIVLVGGKADTTLCAEVASLLAGKVSVEDASGSASLADTAELLDSCAVLLCNDTGVMHLASARGVPLVALFGSTVPELGFAPFRVAHRVMEADDVSCRPCTHIGRNSCPKGHFACMKLVTAGSVAKAAWELIHQKTNEG